MQTTKTMGRPQAAQSTTHTRNDSDSNWLTQRTRRLRIAARCLGLKPIFVEDGTALVAELFDGRGFHVETWGWTLPRGRR